jgi:hypothetical protein
MPSTDLLFDMLGSPFRNNSCRYSVPAKEAHPNITVFFPRPVRRDLRMQETRNAANTRRAADS